MTNRKPLVVVGALWPWKNLYNRSQPLALALARRGYRVFYLDPHERRRIVPSALVRSLQRIRLAPSGRVNVRPGTHSNLQLVEVASLSARSQDWWMRDYTVAAQAVLARYFGRFKQSGVPVYLFTSRPLRVSLLRAFHWSKVIMDVVDPWPLMPWGTLPLAQVGMARMFSRADLIVSNGMSAGEVCRHMTEKTIHNFPNGVEARLVEALRHPGPPPAAFRRGRGRFRVLFAGAMDMRLHYEILASVIPKFPDLDFYFLGRDLVPVSSAPVWRRMLKMNNCFHIQSVSYSQMASFLGNAHALLLPYSEWGSNRMFPAKLLEYVAAARPIFSSAVAPELESVCEAFFVYKDSAALHSALCRATEMSFRLPERVCDSCRNLAQNSTWDRRAEDLCRLWGEE